MATIEVIEADSKALLREFIKYPNRLYRDDPNYVTPLLSERLEFFDTQKNPFYRGAKVKLFLAKRDGETVGRIATCVNYKHNEFHHEKTGFFGFFDTPDEWDIAQKLLKVAMITLKKEGMEQMRGPTNFSTNHECGFLVEGNGQPPVIMMTYNYPYQVHLSERFGLKKAMDLIAFRITKQDGISERIERVVEKMKKRSKITIRCIKLSDFDNEIKLIRQIYNSAWAANWGFVPMDDAEFDYMAKNLKQIVDPRVVFIAEHEKQPVAFSMALPDINEALIYLKGRLFPFGILKLLWHTKIRNKINRVRLVTFGVIPEYRMKAIDSMLYVETYKRGVEFGYNEAELSWVLETNTLMCRAAEEMGAKAYRRYRIMEMPL